MNFKAYIINIFYTSKDYLKTYIVSRGYHASFTSIFEVRHSCWDADKKKILFYLMSKKGFFSETTKNDLMNADVAQIKI